MKEFSETPIGNMPFVKRVVQNARNKAAKKKNPDLMSDDEKRAADWFQVGRTSVRDILKNEKGQAEFFNVPFNG